MVELLIVIVVIAILSTAVIVGFNGVRDRAEKSAVQNGLNQAAKKVQAAAVTTLDGDFPATLFDAGVSDASGDITYQYNRSVDGTSFCLTALYSGKLPYSIGSDTSLSPNPCDGHNGGPEYCPTDTYVPINGFYCNGTAGNLAHINSGVFKLLASDAGVPSNAPGAYVGRQTLRDNYMGSSFAVTSGEVYCISGWAATTSSTVGHTVGIQFTQADGTTRTWSISTYASSAISGWQKMDRCITVPANYVTALVWSQNNGSNGSTADAPWYQTAIRFYRQS